MLNLKNLNNTEVNIVIWLLKTLNFPKNRNKGNENNKNDILAICILSGRITIFFVEIDCFERECSVWFGLVRFGSI